MGATTPTYLLPYPAESDFADVPVDIKKLADRLEIVLAGLRTDLTGDLVWSVLATRAGSVPCDGTLYNSVTDTTFAALYAAIGISYGGTGPTSFAVPDVRGRLLVCKGSHADVNALGVNDGVAVANRTPKHNSSSALSFAGANQNTGTVSADHAHYTSGNTGGRSAQHDHTAHIYQNAGGFGYAEMAGANTGSSFFGDTASGVGEGQEHTHAFGGWSGGISANHVHNLTCAGTVSGTVGPGGTRPVDMPSYIVENCFIVK